jgi:hypothetical protein
METPHANPLHRSESTLFKIDHLLIAVDHLASAKQQYESYGFNVAYGGTEKSALNALIFLKDGTAIELVGKDRFPMRYRILNWLRLTMLFGLMKDRITTFPQVREGFFNYCLFAEDLKSAHQHLQKAQVAAEPPTPFSRQRDDGVVVKWELIGTRPYDLPFVIGRYTPERLRTAALAEHGNKATSIEAVVVETTAIDRYIELYEQMYGVQSRVEAKDRMKNAYFSVGNITLELRQVSSMRPFFKGALSTTKSFTVKCEALAHRSAVALNEYLTLVP